jgi:hypothetical protein
MSQATQAPCDGITGEIEQRRESLERLADSDYPIANTAEALLELAEESDE